MRKAVDVICVLVVLALVVWGLHLKNQLDQSSDEVAMLQSVIDSVESIEEQPPDTIVRDTTIYKDTTVFVTTEFEEPQEDDSINHYQDSIVNDTMRVWVDVYANELYDIEWQYEPVIQKRIKKIKVPHPVIVEKPVEAENTFNRGVYLTGGVGFNDGFTGNAGLGYMPNQDMMYGVNVTRINDKTIYGFQINKRLFP